MPSFAAVSANVAFTSDYVWRGMTQSDGPAIQGGFDYEADGGFYAGIWGSNVNFNDGAGSELDLYLASAAIIARDSIIFSKNVSTLFSNSCLRLYPSDDVIGASVSGATVSYTHLTLPTNREV